MENKKQYIQNNLRAKVRITSKGDLAYQSIKDILVEDIRIGCPVQYKFLLEFLEAEHLKEKEAVDYEVAEKKQRKKALKSRYRQRDNSACFHNDAEDSTLNQQESKL